MNTYRRALRDFQDYSDDVSRANAKTLPDALRRFASTLHTGTPLGDVVARLPRFDFDSWYERQRSTQRSMVGSADLSYPHNSEERLAAQVELIRRIAAGQIRLVDFSATFLWVANNSDANTAEFVRQIFRPFVRDFLRFVHDDPEFEARLHSGDETPIAPVVSELTLFISHSSADEAIARALIRLFEKALKISARKIRCTSIDGYRLPAGADTNDVLRTEVFGAELLVGLVTPTSIGSAYVLFELGARWGARRPLFPVLAGGATIDHLRGPLGVLNALNASVPDQVRQLIEDAAVALALPLEPMASFSAEIEAVVHASSGAPAGVK
ncbi:MAG TPA: toll/interleukin-1 receptor domain-containing protein [Longimicrobium sp.]|jgi:hypothetical protein